MRKDSANNKSNYSEKEPPNLDSRSPRFTLERVFGEMRATSKSTELLYKDPVNASQLYRALRNLRVHFGRAMVVLEIRRLVSDEPHWYVQNLDPSAYRLLRHAPSLMTN